MVPSSLGLSTAPGRRKMQFILTWGARKLESRQNFLSLLSGISIPGGGVFFSNSVSFPFLVPHEIKQYH